MKSYEKDMLGKYLERAKTISVPTQDKTYELENAISKAWCKNTIRQYMAGKLGLRQVFDLGEILENKGLIQAGIARETHKIMGIRAAARIIIHIIDLSTRTY